MFLQESSPIQLERGHREWSARSPRRLVVPIGVVFALAILAATAVLILGMRAREQRDAERNLLGLDSLISEETVRTLQGVDLVLSGIATDLVARGNDDPVRFLTQQEGRPTHLALLSKLDGLPQIDALALVAADGRVLNSSRGWPVPRSSIIEGDAFAALRNADAGRGNRLVIGQPIDDRGTGTRTLPIARRVVTPSGELAGLVVGTIRLDYFRDLFADIQPAQIEVTLWSSDGAMLLRSPSSSEKREPQRLTPVALARMTKGRPTLSHVALGSDPDILVADMRTSSYPVIVSVTQSDTAALAEWRHDATAVGAGGIGCAGLVLLLTWMLMRVFRAYETAADAVIAREEAVRGREAAEEQLRQAQKMEAIGQLTAGLAHDFNNLLTSIVGNLDLLDDRGKGQRPLEIIRQATDRAVSLTRQLLAFSRQQILQPQPVAFDELLDGMIDLLRSSVGGAITVERQLEVGIWPIFADGVQIENLILNLAINARDAMPKGGLLAIEAANVAKGSADLPPGVGASDFVRLTVRDTGTGMPPEVLARAFDPFFTTKPPGKGTGLGLSQVYGFAKQSGGGVAIKSVPNEGTTVSVFLPRAKGVAAKPLPPPVELTVQAPPSCAVMVVDDDSLVRETVARALMAMGCTPLTEPDADSALRRLERGAKVDAMLLDFSMPGMTGAELAARLRQARPELPIVFMTGYGDPATLNDEKLVLRKPFRSAELAQMLRQMLNLAQNP